MNLHEYQAKHLLSEARIKVPRSHLIESPSQAPKAYRALSRHSGKNSRFACYIKAQVHSGARGKSGGVVLAKNPLEAKKAASKLFKKRLVTPQTGPDGLFVRKLLIEEEIHAERFFYAAITIDRFRGCPVILFGEGAGIDVEVNALKNKGSIKSVDVDPVAGLNNSRLAEIMRSANLPHIYKNKLTRLLKTLWRLAKKLDASLIEINPLAALESGQFIALDVKVVIDENAFFRQPQLLRINDQSQSSRLERMAQKINVSYVSLDGNIGCLVNGAGLAMATNDLINLLKGLPANFLDIGGGAEVYRIRDAFRILFSDEKVKVVLVNIFGGITRCDSVAKGLLLARNKIKNKIPLVVRFSGTYASEGRQILKKARLNCILANDFSDAVEVAVKLSMR